MVLPLKPLVIALAFVLSVSVVQAQSNLSDYAGDAALTTPSIAPKATPASPPA